MAPKRRFCLCVRANGEAVCSFRGHLKVHRPPAFYVAVHPLYTALPAHIDGGAPVIDGAILPRRGRFNGP